MIFVSVNSGLIKEIINRKKINAKQCNSKEIILIQPTWGKRYKNQLKITFLSVNNEFDPKIIRTIMRGDVG